MRPALLPPLAVLLAYGVAFATAALGFSLLVYDDHPGQLYRAWHVVVHGFAPWAWNDGWWAGYPELQFYPPGLPYLTALLHLGSLGRLPVAGAYQTLLWVAYLAPGVTTFALLVRLAGDGWRALPGAFVALTLAAGVASGVEGGIHWGMVAARLGWALLPLLVLVLRPWTERGGRFPPIGIALVAAIVLVHPAHFPTAVAVVGLTAWLGRGRRAARVAQALLALAVAAALTAFWTLPLIAHIGETRALAWGSIGSFTADLARHHPLSALLLGLAIAAWWLRPGTPAPEDGRTAAVVAALPWVTLLVVAIDALVLDPLGIRWLPADRIVDGAALAIVLAAGTAAGALLAYLQARWRVPLALGALAAVAAAVLLSLPGETLSLWPRASRWPSYQPTTQGLRLEALWSLLRGAPEGRTLFVRSAVPLAWGTEWWRPHTHLTALTPLTAGRPIVNGTFTHPSPVAALVYRGNTGRGPVTRLAEQIDGHSLFGRPLDELDASTLAAHAARLGVGTIVALEDDLPGLRGIDGSAAVGPRIVSPPFVVYALRRPVTLARAVGRDRWRLTLGGAPGTWASARMAYYPLWRAEHRGRPLAVRRGASGELEVQVPPGSGEVDLLYRPGPAEWTGLTVSLAALAALAWRTRRAARPGGRS